jgi:hypothetical protein
MLRSPLWWPLWPVQRFGPIPVWIAGIVMLTAVERLAPRSVVGAVVLAWLAWVVYTWVGPPLIRRLYLGRGR